MGEFFKDISLAYSTLSDDEKRAIYDKGGELAIRGGKVAEDVLEADVFKTIAICVITVLGAVAGAWLLHKLVENVGKKSETKKSNDSQDVSQESSSKD